MRPLLAAVLCGGRQGSSERVIMQLVVVISSTHEGGESDDVGFCSADTQNFNEERSCVISETGGKESTLSKTLSLSREENMPMKKGMVFVEGGEFLMGTDKPGILIDGSDILTRPNYPVVHISWNDAKAFCAWKKCRLPSEAEWEFACKKALNGTAFPWGDDSEGAEEQSSSNIWQGVFPDTNTMADGHVFTAPVDAYDYMKGLRVKNMIGNVWEWTEDVWSTKHADNGRHEDPALADGNHRVKKGGSFMCHASYCFRYRCEARSQNTPDTSA
ncbi:sulfatase-modifying factor 1-like, partial [Tropilaelaps mercedesae]